MENSLNINVIIAVACGIYAAFNLYFMLEKFRIREWWNECYFRIYILFNHFNMLYRRSFLCNKKNAVF